MKYEICSLKLLCLLCSHSDTEHKLHQNSRHWRSCVNLFSYCL